MRSSHATRRARAGAGACRGDDGAGEGGARAARVGIQHIDIELAVELSEGLALEVIPDGLLRVRNLETTQS